MKAVALSKSKDNNLHCKKLTAVVLGKSKDNNFNCKKKLTAVVLGKLILKF